MLWNIFLKIWLKTSQTLDLGHVKNLPERNTIKIYTYSKSNDYHLHKQSFIK